MSVLDLHHALTTAVRSAVGTTPLARENCPFTKPTNAKWAALYFLPNTPQGETLGDEGQDLATGIMQVDFHYPAETGDAAADVDLETFRASFKAGHGFTYNGQGVVVRNCGAPLRRKQDNWFTVSVTIGWYALVAR